MPRNPTVGILVFVCGLVPFFSHAGDSASAPIIVTATRTAQTADETLASVTVISRAEIEKAGARDLADLLRLHAGIDIGRNGGPGQATSLFMRGTESNHTLVLLDGVRINPGTIGGAPVQNINPETIDRIEIVRGPHSTLYGSDAIGGVIQIFTRKTKDRLDVNAYLGGGEDNARRAGGRLQGNIDNVAAGLSVDYEDTDGFPTITSSDTDRGHDNLTANAYLGVNLDAWDLKLNHWQSEGNTEYLDQFTAPPGRLDQDFENSVTSLTLRATPSGIWAPTLILSQLRDDIQQQQGNDYIRTRRNTLDWQNDFIPNDQHIITAGLFLSSEETDSLSFGTAFDEDTDVHALFVQDNFRSGPHNFLVSARHTDHEGFDNHNTWSVAYGYQIDQSTRMFTSAGTAFRAPDATDRFGFGGNPDLDPETSRNFEIGIQKTIDTRQRLKAALFRNTIDELIAFNDPDGFLGPIPGMNKNIEKARIRGLELHYAMKLGNLTAMAEAIFQDPEDKTSGEQLARRARRTLTTNLNYDFNRFSAGLDWLVTSKRKDSGFSDVKNAGYGLLNINFSTPVSDELTVYGKIENLLDRKYTLADGFRTQGRALFVTLRYQPHIN